MALQQVSLRLPADVVAAYDDAAGTRSALMRRQLADGVVDGELQGVGDDLQVLAEREAIIDRARLERKRSTFRKRAYDEFRDQFGTGLVTPDDADALAESYRDEAALYGEQHLRFLEALLAWYGDNWSVAQDRDFPDPGYFMRRVDEGDDLELDVDLTGRLASVMRDAREAGLDRGEAVERVRAYHDDDLVRRAADRAYGDDGDGGAHA